MLLTCWSVKGGSGTTVVAAALALLAAERRSDTWLIDLAGDVPAVLGAPEPYGAGIRDWLAAPDTVGPEAVARLARPVGDRLSIIPAGDHASPDERRWSRLVDMLVARGAPTVVDLGIDVAPAAMHHRSVLDLLVLRPCYLATRRAAALTHQPSGVIVVEEPGRSLRAVDVAAAARAPVVADVLWDPEVARSVDSGMLAGRLPRSLRNSLEDVTWPS